jgi:hypothetical protein
MIGIFEPGPEKACFEVRPERVVPQHLLVFEHGLPVAAFYLRVDRAKCRALVFNIVGLG